MAKFPRGLCFILAVWLVLSRPSAAGRTESPNHSPWWGTEQLQSYQWRAAELRNIGNYPALENLYKEAAENAARAGDAKSRVSYQTALANTYVYMFRYAEALDAYQSAAKYAEESGDWEAAGAVAPGLSSLYYLVGDWPAARIAVEEGLANTRRLPNPPYYHAQLILQQARLQADFGDDVSAALQSVDAARAHRDLSPKTPESLSLEGIDLESTAWDLVGREQIRHGRWVEAEEALGQALKLRLTRLPRHLHFSHSQLGALRLAQAQAKETPTAERAGLLVQAETFTELSMEEANRSGYEMAAAVLFHQRGLIRQAQGYVEEALEDFAAAARMADRWRLVVPSAGSSFIAANAQLEGKVFRTFAEASARQALLTQEPQWLRTSFLAAELNRAASLRQSQQLAEVWRRKLPSQYWAVLTKLRIEDAKHMGLQVPNPAADRLNLELSKMEATAGLGFSQIGTASRQDTASLTPFQQGLKPAELLLSFHTGVEASYLWAMTQTTLHIYELPPVERLEAEVKQFREAIVARHSRAEDLGATLYRDLFGQLNAQEFEKTAWILSLENPLFELPFAALTEAGRSETYLVEHHSLQIVPGALFLQQAPQISRTHHYLGVGDPVYNAADARATQVPWYRRTGTPATSVRLNRLVASRDEVDRSAAAWQTGFPGLATVLFGISASREQFLQTLESTAPATIHLATHVLTQQGNGEQFRNQAFLAFSMGTVSAGEAGKQSGPGLLATTDVARLRVPGALVVLTGCASGTGDVVAGAGLLGLTRAWLIAGASAVVATGWAMEDSHGELLPSFFRNVQNLSVAEALRRSQVQMIHSGNWQSDPSYWASFKITGGAR